MIFARDARHARAFSISWNNNVKWPRHARGFSILKHLIDVLRETTTWNYQIWSNISNTSASVSSEIPNTETRFYCFEVFGTPDETRSTKHEARKFLRWLLKLVWKFHGIFSRRIGHQKVWSTGNCSFFIHMVNEWIFNIHFVHEAMCIDEY